ncbi:MAG: hypothetical protein CL760_10725 [Chloroflexi bacterium]|nr:hypothetical protein [Chloroflexota bacterium]|tara:strand:- start:35166 stop:35807 length:642 start_codon:yes stop_codon:yes gene_type:complete
MRKMTTKSMCILSALLSFNVYSNEPEWKSELQNELKLHGVKSETLSFDEEVAAKGVDFDVDIIINDFEDVIVDIDIDHDHYDSRPTFYENDYDNYYDGYMSRYLEVNKRTSFCRIMAAGERNKRVNYWIQKSCHKELSYLPKINVNGHKGDNHDHYHYEDHHHYHNKKIGYVFEYNSDYQFCLGMSKYYNKKNEHKYFMKKCSNKIEALPYLF